MDYVVCMAAQYASKQAKEKKGKGTAQKHTHRKKAQRTVSILIWTYLTNKCDEQMRVWQGAYFSWLWLCFCGTKKLKGTARKGNTDPFHETSTLNLSAISTWVSKSTTVRVWE